MKKDRFAKSANENEGLKSGARRRSLLVVATGLGLLSLAPNTANALHLVHHAGPTSVRGTARRTARRTTRRLN